MNASEEGSPQNLDRLSGLTAWWGVPNIANARAIDVRAKRYQGFVADLNRLFSEASSRQAQALAAANQQFAGALQDILSARQPPELIAAQSGLVKGLMESMAVQAKSWAELTWKIQGCCAAMVHETAAETRERAGQTKGGELPSRTDRAVAKESTKRSARR